MHTEVVIHSMNAYVWCWSKICGSLDEIPFLLQWEVVKVKFLMNSIMTLTVLYLHQKTDPKMQQDFKGQGHYDKVKSRSHHDAVHIQPLTNVRTIRPDKIFIGQGHYGKVKSR